MSNPRKPMPAWEQKLRSRVRKEWKAKYTAAIAALTPAQIDAILADVHGDTGLPLGQLAAKHGIETMTLCEISRRYIDRTTWYTYHKSIAEARAWRAKRRAARKAARAPRTALQPTASTPTA